MSKKAVFSPNAPKAIGPYSQAVRVGDLLFCSGQIPLTAEGNLVQGDVASQTHQVLKNLSAVLGAAGGTLENVVKTTIFLADMNDFTIVNDIYGSYFGEPYPARATVEVSKLPKSVRIEIEAVAKL